MNQWNNQSHRVFIGSRGNADADRRGVRRPPRIPPPTSRKSNVTIEIWWHEYGPFTAYVKELIEAYKKRPAERDHQSRRHVLGRHQPEADRRAGHRHRSRTSWTRTPRSTSCTTPRGCWNRSTWRSSAPRATTKSSRATRRAGLAAGTFGGKVYALPYQGNSMSLFLSNKAFEAAGLSPVKDAPKTWNDMMALGPKLKKVQGNRTVQKAFDFPYHSPRWEMQMFQPLVEQFGGKTLVRRRQDRVSQQPRGGEGADAVARRHQGDRRPEDDDEHAEQPEPGLHRRPHGDVGHRDRGRPRRSDSRRSATTSPSCPIRRSIRPSRTPSCTAGCGA